MIKPLIYRVFAFLLFTFAVKAVNAQKLFTVTGVTFTSGNQARIAQVVINNINRRTISRSDDRGVFSIQAASGDTLLFNNPRFTPQKIVVYNDNLLSVYLRPVVVLEEVTVNDMSTRQELAATMDNYRKKIPLGTTRPGVGSYLFSPVSGLSNLFGKSASNARRFERFSKREMEDVEIEKRYNKGVIKKVIADISEEDLTAFMLAFKPSYDQIKIWADYDIIKYIQDSYAYFTKNRHLLQPQKLY